MRYIFEIIKLLSVQFVLMSVVNAQSDTSLVVQLSGVAVDSETFDPIPYSSISVLNTSRGTYTDENGFFSFAVKKSDRMKFTSVGYKEKFLLLPDSLDFNRFDMLIFAEKDTLNLPEVTVMPWPSREHFRIEFLELDVSDELQERALQNLAMETLERLKYEVPTDANEHGDFYLRQQAADFYYYGQIPPQRIFDPNAWIQFIQMLKKEKNKKK